MGCLSENACVSHRNPNQKEDREMTDRADIYSRVTECIVTDLENGVRSWVRPWSAEHVAGRIIRPLRSNGMPYQGINVLILWGESLAKGYTCPVWITFNQAKELGGFVSKGEHGSQVVYAGNITKTEEGEDGTESERQIHFLKTYTVFNVEQIEGLPDAFYLRPPPVTATVERLAEADAFIRATGAVIRIGGTQAFYSAGVDAISMPPAEAFRDRDSYYATILHELTHWTRHPSRLERDFGRKRFGDEGYAQEELVAELGAAFLCADLGVTLEPREDHAAYIGSWLQVLKSDKRAIFSAAAHAQRAAGYLHGLQPNRAQEAA
jgi:antirestriction protein ArdC